MYMYAYIHTYTCTHTHALSLSFSHTHRRVQRALKPRTPTAPTLRSPYNLEIFYCNRLARICNKVSITSTRSRLCWPSCVNECLCVCSCTWVHVCVFVRVLMCVFVRSCTCSFCAPSLPLHFPLFPFLTHLGTLSDTLPLTFACSFSRVCSQETRLQKAERAIIREKKGLVQAHCGGC